MPSMLSYIKISVWIRLTAILFILKLFQGFLSVSAFSPHHVSYTRVKSKQTSALPLYPYISTKPRTLWYRGNQFCTEHWLQSKISRQRPFLDKSVHLSLASDSDNEPEQKTIRRLLQSYNLVGRFLKQIFRILVRLASSPHFFPSHDDR